MSIGHLVRKKFEVKNFRSRFLERSFFYPAEMATDEMATHTLGNTKARACQLTLNEVDRYPKLKEYLTGLKTLNYLVSCKEIAPTTGHEHIHVYCQFKNAIKLSVKKCCGAHIEKCRGTPQQNVDYIKKDGEILDEIGKLGNWGGSLVKDLKEIDDSDDLDWHAYNTYKKIKADQANLLTVKDFRKEVKVYWIQGESGIGKTEKALSIIGDKTFCEAKFNGDFWIGLHPKAECLLYDDFRDSHMKPSEFINFIDYNVHNMNIKGGSIKNKFSTVIVTTVQRIEDIYCNVGDEPRRQWMRRVEVIDLYGSEYL